MNNTIVFSMLYALMALTLIFVAFPKFFHWFMQDAPTKENDRNV